MKCHACGKEMEEGYVAASGAHPIGWFSGKPRLLSIGEPLMQPLLLGPRYLIGNRCSSCKIVVMSYDHESSDGPWSD